MQELPEDSTESFKESGIWQILVRFCLDSNLRFFYAGGEPWFSSQAIAKFLQIEEPETLRKKLAGCPRHPLAAGMVRLSDLEARAYEQKKGDR